MTFKEQYLSGMCNLDYVDQCMREWRLGPGNGVHLKDFMGLTDEEYGLLYPKYPSDRLQSLLDSQRRCQCYRIYQLDLSGGKTVPFAFAGIKKMRESGYDQPPASMYRLVCDGAIFCPNAQSEDEVLERILTRYSVCFAPPRP